MKSDKQQTIDEAVSRGFKVTGTGAVKAVRELGFDGLDYTCLYNSQSDMYLRVHYDGSFRLTLPNGDRKHGQAGELAFTLRTEVK